MKAPQIRSMTMIVPCLRIARTLRPTCLQKQSSTRRSFVEFMPSATNVKPCSVGRNPQHESRLYDSRRPGLPSLDLHDMIHPNANDMLTVRSVFIMGQNRRSPLGAASPANQAMQVLAEVGVVLVTVKQARARTDRADHDRLGSMPGSPPVKSRLARHHA